MHTARPSARPPAFVAAAAAAFLAFASFVNTGTTRACLVSAPLPLRQLHAESDLIVVGGFGETTAVELVRVNEGGTYENYLMRTDMKVSSTVKGDGNYSALHVYHVGWKYNGATSHLLTQYKGADGLLVFLKRREGGDGYEITDATSGIRRLTSAALKVYVQRLEELDSIMRQEPPDRARIVEWMVRCAEEPATRWDGLYELSRSNDAVLAAKRLAEEEKNKEAAALAGAAEKDGDNQAGGAAGATDTAAGVETNGGPADTSAAADAAQTATPPMSWRRILARYEADLIGLLTPEQKSRLANILFSAKPITHAELPLVEMVRQWGDPRLVPFVMSQLRAFKDAPPYEAETLVSGLAEILDDKELTRLAERYCDQAAYEDPDLMIVGDEDEEAESADAGDEDGEKEDEDEQPVYGNSTERRSIRLERFIARAENVLAR